jgi:hypothetical protein
MTAARPSAEARWLSARFDVYRWLQSPGVGMPGPSQATSPAAMTTGSAALAVAEAAASAERARDSASVSRPSSLPGRWGSASM